MSEEAEAPERVWVDRHGLRYRVFTEAQSRECVEYVRALAWRPIESAPKDGTRILIWSLEKKCVLSVYWDPQFEYVYTDDSSFEYKGAWTDDAILSFGDEETHSYRPEHWLPLPCPPGETP